MGIYSKFAAIFAVIYAFPVFAENRFYSHQESHLGAIPNSISIPNAFRPDGIVRGYGPQAYVSSIDSGSIYQVDLLTGEGSLLVNRQGASAVGLAYDERSNYLFVTGGKSGRLDIYDASDGELKMSYQLSKKNSFINDGVICRDAAYFTNSQAMEFYRIPLSKVGRLPIPEKIETIKFSQAYEFVENSVNSNGIETSRDGKHLIIINSSSGKLYKVHPRTGKTREITIINGDLKHGDGLLLRGNRLYVVQNQLNQIAEVILDSQATSGKILRTLKNILFRVPTSLTAYQNDLFVVNARFGTPVQAETDYDIVRVPIKRLF